MAKARTATDIGTLEELVDLSGRFERLMVIPGSFAVLLAGLLAAWAQGQAASRSRRLVAAHVADPVRRRRRARADGVPAARQDLRLRAPGREATR